MSPGNGPITPRHVVSAICCGLACSLGALAAEPSTSSPEVEVFNREIAPLLAKRCLECHSASERQGGLDLTQRESAISGGDSESPAIVPGDPEASFAMLRIAGDEMPPKHPLPEAERQLLKNWIAAGAAWSTDPIDPLRYTSEKRAGYDWWSLQPLAEVTPPAPCTAWERTPIDAFIAARLTQEGLTPSPEASRETLVRRLAYDLWGLPPSLEMVEHFLADESPYAYERLLDEMLASPFYGQRWARHWLDVARFGESQGFERDKLRTNSWAYRDWVVDAFNSDMPYDRFASRQIAGDVLKPAAGKADPVATGFLVAAPYDEVGQTQQSAAMRAVVRQDELEDYVSVVGQTFVGLTVNCARCHDHKFDPISQVEYYRLAAALAGVRHGEIEAPQAARPLLAEGYAARREALSRELEKLERPIRANLLAARGNRAADSPESIAAADLPAPIVAFDAAQPLDKKQWSIFGVARFEEERLHLDGQTAYLASPPIERDLQAKTLEAWVSLDDLGQQGGAALSVQTLDGVVFDAIVFGEIERGRWMAGSDGFARTRSFHGPEETSAAGGLVHLAIVYQTDGRIVGYRDGRLYGESYASPGLVTYPAKSWQVLIGLRHTPGAANKFLAGVVARARVYDRALSAEEVAASAGLGPRDDYVAPEEIAARMSDDDRRQAEAWRFEIAALSDLERRARATSVYAVAAKPCEPTHVLHRGNPADKGELVAAGAVSAVQGPSKLDLSSDANDAARREALAQWLAGGDNPLFARVMVNRVWKWHFGEGLVDSTSDFGFNGGRPSHPELLDWLAREFIHQGFSIKALHRTICASAVYRQTSAVRPDCAAIDAASRLLWRKPPQRVEAEALRDAALFAAGDLDPALGGPGFYDFRTYVLNSQFYEMLDPVGASFQRRSLYRTWVRSGRSALLDAFDCPDPSTKTPSRAVTTTPLQALALLNDSFMLRMSERFAARLAREAGDDPRKQIELAFRLAYSRPAAEEEFALAAPFVAEHGLWAFCRVLLNGNEFLFVD